MNIDFGANRTPLEIIKGGAFGVTVNGTEKHGKNLMIYETLIKIISAQIILMLILINMVLNVEYH